MLAKWQEFNPINWVGPRELTQEFSNWLEALVGDPRRCGSWQFNLSCHDNNYVLQIALPGFKPDSIEAEVLNDFLTIRASRCVCELPDDAHYLYRERGVADFEETVKLPGQVDADKVTAKYVNGVLTITMPKAATATPQTIKVNAE